MAKGLRDSLLIVLCKNFHNFYIDPILSTCLFFILEILSTTYAARNNYIFIMLIDSSVRRARGEQSIMSAIQPSIQPARDCFLFLLLLLLNRAYPPNQGSADARELKTRKICDSEEIFFKTLILVSYRGKLYVNSFT